MRIGRGVLLLALLVCTRPVQAITWNFDTAGDTQGWIARDSDRSIATDGAVFSVPLQSEVADGVWRTFLPEYEPGRQPSLELVSPVLRHDSALFDQLRLRLRVVHPRPVYGGLYLRWQNTLNEGLSGVYSLANPDSLAASINYLTFFRNQRVDYTTDWQEVVVADLRPSEFMIGRTKYRVAWEGELLDLRLTLILFDESPQVPFEPSPDAMPQAVEVDWIRLTGIEEQLQGELPPPAGSLAAGPGQYLAPAEFWPVGRSGLGFGHFREGVARLGDTDADGDPDLISLWNTTREQGWLVAENQGEGQFVGPVAISADWPPPSTGAKLDAADLNADGRAEMLVGLWPNLQLLENREREGWVPALDRTQAWPLGLGDADRDGDVDLWFGDMTAGWSTVVLLNDGAGAFRERLSWNPELADEGYAGIRLVRDVPGGGITGLLSARGRTGDAIEGYLLTYLDEQGEMVKEPLAARIPLDWIRYVGDYDQDGDTDVIAVTAQHDFSDDGLFQGLTLWGNPGDGQLQPVPWFSEVVVSAEMALLDLDGDPWPDPVFVDVQPRGPALVVCRGVRAGLPPLEGRYPLSGAGARAVLGGDVDGDRDTDVAVLEYAKISGGSGVWVLLNQLAERRTAVTETASPGLPAAFNLGPNYPNPFNPETWIPVEIPASTESVRLWIYNLLGQPIRTLVSGRLTPGYHAVPWDGRDEGGVAVTSGVYLYRLEAGAWRATGKMVKSE
ncbi:MAG: FG-GAP-like repeat-containing protein [Candidatus Latescibacterota bacterium]